MPQSLLNLTMMCRFAGNQNRFWGSIPQGITKNIRMLDLSHSNLSWEMPSSLLSPDNLEAVFGLKSPFLGHYLVRLIICVYILYMAYLELNNNQIVASIPSQLGKCNSLNLLDLSSNKLQGALPADLGITDRGWS